MTTAIIISANGFIDLSLKCLESLAFHTVDYRTYFQDGVPQHLVTSTWNRQLIDAVDDGCEAAVVLNNDCRVTEGWLAPLLQGLDHYDLVGPTSNSAGGYPRQTREAPRGAGKQDGYTPTSMLNGFCLCAEIEWWERYLFDDTLFLGCEDELIIRSKARCAVAHASYVHHVGGATRGTHA